MVAEIQLLSELYHEETTPVHFLPLDSYSTDDQIALIAFLLNLQEYYEIYESLTAEQILERLDADFTQIKQEMSDLFYFNCSKGMGEVEELLDKFNIRRDWFGSNWVGRWADLDLFSASIEATLNQLHDDLKVKCLAFQVYNLDVLNLAPNFRRAIKNLSDDVTANIRLAKDKAVREIYSFVYGKDMLYRWVCVNDMRTCAVCRALSRESPKKIDEWGYDHPHGRCSLVPVSESYSQEYLDYLENYA